MSWPNNRLACALNISNKHKKRHCLLNKNIYYYSRSADKGKSEKAVRHQVSAGTFFTATPRQGKKVVVNNGTNYKIINFKVLEGVMRRAPSNTFTL
jgi:hypothetical protein